MDSSYVSKGRRFDVLSEALAAIQRGWVLIPLSRKHPFTAGNGSKSWREVRTEERVRFWWVRDAQFGVWLSRSNLVVIDIDPRNGGDLADADRFPPTLTQATGSNGLHLIYTAPGVPLVGKDKDGISGEGTGIDVLTNGYIVLAPGFPTPPPNMCVELRDFGPWKPYGWVNNAPVAPLDTGNIERLRKTGSVRTSPDRTEVAPEAAEADRSDSPSSISVPSPSPEQELANIPPSTRRRLEIVAKGTHGDDSARDFLIAAICKADRVCFEAFAEFIAELPRKKVGKAYDLRYLELTWSKATASEPTRKPREKHERGTNSFTFRPSPSTLLSLTSPLPHCAPEAGISPAHSVHAALVGLDPRQARSVRLVVGFLCLQAERLGAESFRQSRAEVARATRLTEKTVTAALRHLQEQGLVVVSADYVRPAENSKGTPRRMDVTPLLRALGRDLPAAALTG